MRKRQVLAVVAANVLGVSLPATLALADAPAPGQAQEAGSSSVGTPSQRSGSPKARTRKSPGKPGQFGNFIYEILNNIRAQSEDLCARYGSPGDCLEEAEVCLTMRDTADNQVRLCLNTVPGEGTGHEGKVQKSRMRR